MPSFLGANCTKKGGEERGGATRDEKGWLTSKDEGLGWLFIANRGMGVCDAGGQPLEEGGGGGGVE